MSVPYSITSERLVARCWDPADAPRVRESLDASDEHLRPWIPFMASEPRTLAATVEWLRKRRAWFDRDENYAFALFTAGEAELVGEVLLLARVGAGGFEIGYWIDVRRGGRGYATHGAALATRVAFELLAAERVEIHCSTRNAPSSAVARKLGFTREAVLGKRARDTEGNTLDLEIWTLFEEEYAESAAKLVKATAHDALGRETPLV